MKKILQAASLALLVFGLVGFARAADVVSPNQQNPNVVVGSTETHKNLYTAGGNVTVNGNTGGDLTVAGGMVQVFGNVEQELLAAGGTLDFNGSVGGTARIAGGNVTVNGPVGGDLVIAGGNVNITGKSVITGDLMIAGGNVTVNAPVGGSVRIAGGDVVIDSKITGNVYARSSRSLEFGSGAQVLGTVYYKGPSKAVLQNGASVPHMEYTVWNPNAGRGALSALITTAFVIRLFAWMIVAWLLLYFKRSWVMRVVERMQANPWSSLGWGAVYFIIIPIVAVALLFTVIGYYLAFLVGISYVLLLMLAKILAAVAVGYLIVKLLSKPTEQVPVWQPVVIGSVVWAILGLIPIVGWVAIAVVFLQALGALIAATVQSVREK